MECRPSPEMTNNFKKIVDEYCSKRGSFNPNKPSPNIFMKKLEFRLKAYYNLFNSRNLYIKKENLVKNMIWKWPN